MSLSTGGNRRDKIRVGVIFTTSLTGENGIIVNFDKVKAAENPGQMLDALE